MKCLNVGLAVVLFATGLVVAGCDRSSSSANGGQDASEVSNRHKNGSRHSQADLHTHGHKHGAPLHGGKIVAIGHSHRGSDTNHYYAEIMPIIDRKITFHVLTGSAESKSQTVQVEGTIIDAYVDPLDKGSAQPFEVQFSSEGDVNGSRFVATIPKLIQDSSSFSVVVPKIRLGGERLNFIFETSAEEALDQSEKSAGGGSN